jgi:Putative 2OG-Fe(II) oxygenase
MTAFQPHVVPIFATPLGLVTVPDAADLNSSVAKHFADCATPERADPASRQPLMYRSSDDLLTWQDEPVCGLTRSIAGAALSVVRSLNGFTDEQFAALQLQMRAWFTIVRPNGYVPAASYANAAWCAIYCVAAPQLSSTQVNGGALRLHESSRTTMFNDATNTLMHAPFQTGHRTWQPVPGQLAVFPAAITHEIASVRAVGDLLLVSMLLRFLAPGQTGIPWW